MSDKRKQRIGRLDSIGGVVDEIKAVYRQCRRGELDSLEGGRLVMMLREIRQAYHDEMVEKRIGALEDRMLGNGRS